MNKKGFTLIELLAVIIILGLLMLIAIPSVTNYINNARKESYIDTARQYVKGATNLVNSGDLDIFDTGVTYYIPTTCIELETGGQSPYGGDFSPAYVIVTYDNDSYNYYWMSRDDNGIGIKTPIKSTKLEIEDIDSGVKATDVTPSTAIDRRKTIIEFNGDCSSQKEPTNSSKMINGDTGEEMPGVIYPNGKTKETISLYSIVRIGDEQFYVIKKDTANNRLVLLARYNLNVGDYQKPDAPYLLQNSAVLGCGVNPTYGTIPRNDAPKYLNEYKSYLESLGATIIESRLLSEAEGGPLPFSVIFTSSFWISDIPGGGLCRQVYSRPGEGSLGGQVYCTYAVGYGVRPVIVIE